MPDFPKAVTAPKDAPNVLLIMTDDTGFGAASTFGGPIPTPTLDRLAKSGLKYNEFHTTALCSPTRAALLTGRNHQSVGMGNITEFATGYPGYTSIMPKSAGTIGNILVDNGYNTAWFGKHHLLASEGCTFVGILDALRLDLAKSYLREQNLQTSEVAWLLGFAEVSAFSHACKRWTGKTPKQLQSAGVEGLADAA